MAVPVRVHGLGQVSIPLDVVQLQGSRKLVISPWAAIGTDVLLIGSGVTLGALMKPLLLKILGYSAATWGSIALGVEVTKLLRDKSEDPMLISSDSFYRTV